MKEKVVVIGMGEMGGVFARGVLRKGHPVYPIGRGIDLRTAAEDIDDPQAVIVAVGEKDLKNVLETVPKEWRSRLVLLQNELLPKDWKTSHIENPTVISVWFEKKPGQDVKVIIPSPVFGPQAALIKDALGTLNIDARVLRNDDDLLFELVVKNVYILTINIAGLAVEGTVGELWGEHQTLARDVANDIMDIQFRLIEKDLDRAKLMEAMVNTFDGDLGHKCMGRSAPARLERAITQAGEFGLKVKGLEQISSETLSRNG